MGLIKGFLFVIASVLLFILFLAGNTFLTMSLSLDYENIKPELSSVVRTTIDEQVDLEGMMLDQMPTMEEHCLNYSEFVFADNTTGHTLVIPCEVVLQGVDAVVEHSIDSFVEEVYYMEYNCDFWNCFEQGDLPFFLVSKKAQNYWTGKFYLSLFLSLMFIALMFFLIGNKTNLPFIVGGLLVVASLPFMKLDRILLWISDDSFFKIFTSFFTQSYTVFLISLIIGIIILVLGVILKFFKVGLWISNFFSKFNSKEEKSKKIVVKKMVSNDNLQKSK